MGCEDVGYKDAGMQEWDAGMRDAEMGCGMQRWDVGCRDVRMQGAGCWMRGCRERVHGDLTQHHDPSPSGSTPGCEKLYYGSSWVLGWGHRVMSSPPLAPPKSQAWGLLDADVLAFLRWGQAVLVEIQHSCHQERDQPGTTAPAVHEGGGSIALVQMGGNRKLTWPLSPRALALSKPPQQHLGADILHVLLEFFMHLGRKKKKGHCIQRGGQFGAVPKLSHLPGYLPAQSGRGCPPQSASRSR